MGSGYFPIKKHSEEGKIILRCTNELEAVYKRLVDNCMVQDQIGNAFFDGVAAGRIALGISLLCHDLE